MKYIKKIIEQGSKKVINMIIKNIEQEFLQSKVDRMDSVTGLDYKSIFKAYIGIEDSESLDLALFKFNNEFKNRKDVVFIENLLQITTDFNSIEKAKEDYQLVERTNFKQSGLRLVNDLSFNSVLLDNLDKLFELLDNEIKHTKANFATKFMLWIRDYLSDLKLENSEIPKCVYYGNIKKHESYFLMFLNMCGFDVLYINPNGLSNIKIVSSYTSKLEIYENPIISEVISLKERVLNGEVIDKSTVNKATTVTAHAQRKIQEELYNDTGMIIDSWQLQDCQLKPIMLNTTFEEISIYYNQALNFRPHYKSSNGIIEAPVFFSKIIGVHDKDDDYYDFVNTIKKNENTLFLEFLGNENILKTKEFTKADFKLTYLIDTNGNIDRKGTVNENEFEISILETKLQNKILDALEDVFKSRFFVEEIGTNDKVQMLHFALNLNRKLLLLIENFAYGRVNPKLVLYINERVSMSKEFCAMLLLMNKLGVDVLLLTPVGSKDIEKVLDENIVDTHRLSKIVERFNLSELEQLKSSGKSFIGKLFDKFKI